MCLLTHVLIAYLQVTYFHFYLNIWVQVTQSCIQLMHNLQVTGDETQVLQSVLECDTEREKLLEEERKLLALTGHEGYAA